MRGGRTISVRDASSGPDPQPSRPVRSTGDGSGRGAHRGRGSPRVHPRADHGEVTGAFRCGPYPARVERSVDEYVEIAGHRVPPVHGRRGTTRLVRAGGQGSGHVAAVTRGRMAPGSAVVVARCATSVASRRVSIRFGSAFQNGSPRRSWVTARSPTRPHARTADLAVLVSARRARACRCAIGPPGRGTAPCVPMSSTTTTLDAPAGARPARIYG